MGIYRGPGGTGDATNDAASEATLVSQLVTQAQESEANAASSATSAGTSATNASNSASAASTSATNAASSAASALSSKNSAATSEANALTYKNAAATSATNAATSATNAASSASSASTSASTATTQATNASSSASSAATSATNAAASATTAASDATLASNSSATSSYYASYSAARAVESANSATAAATSASTATTQASTATTQAGIATTKASEAATSATNAATSASTATTQAGIATTQATNAATSATSSASSATASAAARDAALAALDSFDDRYLGQKATEPTLDNDGNALVTGALYFNTVANVMKVYDGTNWLAAYASLSGALLVTNNLSDLNNAASARTNLGLGTIATQAASSVAVTGGAIDGTTIGSTTRSTGKFTSLDYNTTLTGGTGVVNLGSGQFYKDASGNVGIGVTPSAWLSTLKALQVGRGNLVGSTSGGSVLSYNSYYNGSNWIYQNTAEASRMEFDLSFRWYLAGVGTAGNTVTSTQAMTLDASGNLGLGVTPSAWGSFSGKALDINGGAAVLGSNLQALFTSNAYFTTGWTYKSSSYANYYVMTNNGQHQWFNAPSGTAGNAITFTQAMTLDASGNLLVGTSTIPSGVGGKNISLQGAGANFALVDNNGTTQTWRIMAKTGTTTLFRINDATASADRLVIDGSGNVGIGTSSPATLIEAQGSGAGGVFSLTNSGSGTEILYGRIAMYANGLSGAYKAYGAEIRGYSGAGIDSSTLRFYTSNASATAAERMRIDSSGNVGIGTSSPSQKLVVAQGTKATTAAVTNIVGFQTTDASTFGLYIRQKLDATATNRWMGLTSYDNGVGAANLILQDLGGSVGIGNTNPSSFNSTANQLVVGDGVSSQGITIYTASNLSGSILFAKGTTTSDAYRGYIQYGQSGSSAPDAMLFGTAATERMRIDSAGNVGIGTSSPAKKLDVNGDASISGLTVGKGGGAIGTNSAVGVLALGSNTTGQNNSAYGYLSLYANTTGIQNNAFGQSALGANTTGSANSAFGFQSLQANTTASNNTAVGYQAGYSNTTGSGLVVVGFQAGYSNTTGVSNTALGGGQVGVLAPLNSNTTGSYNTALGNGALGSNTTASNNTAVGYQAGYTNQTGTLNTYLGYQAGYVATGNYNAFIGSRAGLAVTTGTTNTFVGDYCGAVVTTGSTNTFIGQSSGSAVTTGSKNSIIGGYTGNQGGLDIRTASNYIVLSDGDGNPRQIIDSAGVLLVGATSTSALGVTIHPGGFIRYNTLGSTLSQFWYNGSAVGSITTNGTSTTYSTSSDYRLKENIAPMTGALDIVAQLKPVTYTWKSNGSEGQGFIAHELQSVVPDAVTGEKDAIDEEGKPAYQGIDTSFLVATLTAAIQELKAEFDAYKATHP